MSKIVVANWKMYGDQTSLTLWAKQLATTSHKVVLCVQPLLIEHARRNAHTFQVGGQDCHIFDNGPYTGFTSPALLSAMGASHVIVGHSERRSFESDALIHKKALASIRNNLTPIICIGEPESSREKGEHEAFVAKQIKTITENLQGHFYIAYEPLWAIGTGVLPQLEDIKSMFEFIRSILPGDAPIPILYGGSVNSKNAKSILNMPFVQGVLVGGSSLDNNEFNSIIA